jgi:hypothetical protein
VFSAGRIGRLCVIMRFCAFLCMDRGRGKIHRTKPIFKNGGVTQFIWL